MRVNWLAIFLPFLVIVTDFWLEILLTTDLLDVEFND